jgi:hypothetical protein
VNLIGEFSKLLRALGFAKALLALGAINICHYWGFVVSLKGNVSFLLDTNFFLQFQALFIGHVALVTLAVGFLRATLIVVAGIVQDTIGQNLISKLIFRVCNSFAFALVWVIVFSLLYTGSTFLLSIFPFLVDFPSNIYWVGLFLPLLLVVLIHRAKPKKKSLMAHILKREDHSDLPETPIGLVTATLVSMTLVISGNLGYARASSMQNISASTVFFNSGEISLKIYGTTSYGIVGIERSCNCSMILPFDNIVRIQAPKPIESEP